MRILIFCLFLAMVAGPGCFHRKAAAPQENFTDVPGLPASPPVQQTTEVKPPKKQRALKKAVAQTNAPAAPVEMARTSKPSKVNDSGNAIPTPTEPKSFQQKLIVTPEHSLVGKVEMVNQNARYVVLSFPIGHLPAMEQHLSVYRGGLKIGEVKVSGPQIEDNVVADLVAGDSQPGDEVREN